jgi:hypothetical protein
MTENTASALPTHRLENTLVEMRASVAAQGANGRLAELLQEAVLSLLNVLMTLLADFRAGKLVPIAPGPREEEASDSSVSAACCTSALPIGSGPLGDVANGTGGARWLGLWGWWRRKSEFPQAGEPGGEPARFAGARVVAGFRSSLAGGQTANEGGLDAACPSPQPTGSILGSRARCDEVESARAGDSPTSPSLSAPKGGEEFFRRGDGANGVDGADVSVSAGASPRPSAIANGVGADHAPQLCHAISGEEDGPALYRVRAPRISPSSARAAAGCIQATRITF